MPSTPLPVPGPRPLPLLGRRGNEIAFYRDFIGSLCHLHQTYGSVVGLVQDDPHWVFVFGPEYNQLLLTNPDRFHSQLLALPARTDSALRRVTAGLLSMNGTHHRQQRGLILPAFHKQQIAAYRDAIVAITRQTLDRWRIGQQLDIAQEMRHLTMTVAIKVLFGLDPTQHKEHIGRMITRWLELFASVGVNLLPLSLPGTPYRQLLALSARIEATIRAMIEHKRAAAEQQGDVLALLIHARDEAGAQLNDTELIGQANLLFVAGHETSSNGLTWTLFLLAQHPRILADLHDELTSALHGDAPTTDVALAELNLLALDMALLFIVSIMAMRYRRGGGPLLVLAGFCFLCLVIADGISVYLSWLQKSSFRPWVARLAYRARWAPAAPSGSSCG